MRTVEEGLRHARAIAAQIIAGTLSEEEGAARIWHEVVDVLNGPVPDALWVFKAGASALEDFAFNEGEGGKAHADARAAEREKLRQAAQALLKSA